MLQQLDSTAAQVQQALQLLIQARILLCWLDQSVPVSRTSTSHLSMPNEFMCGDNLPVTCLLQPHSIAFAAAGGFADMACNMCHTRQAV